MTKYVSERVGPQSRYYILLEWKLGAWLSPISWKGFCPFGHERSCQLPSIRLSIAVTTAAYIEGLSGNYKLFC
jgi:hypothetical protein